MHLPTEKLPGGDPPPRTYPILERITTAVLLLVMAALAAMIAAAYSPGAGRLLSVEWEVILMLCLLVAALGLVSLVALLHTR